VKILLCPPLSRLATYKEGSFLSDVINEGLQSGSSNHILKHFSTKSDMSLHTLLVKFLETGKNETEEFLEFARQNIVT